MVTQDRIRLTGLLRRKPRQRGFLYGADFAGDSSGSPRGGLTAVSVEPLGSVARLDREGLCRQRAAPRRRERHTMPSETRIDWLALQRQYTEGALVDAVQRIAAGESFERFDP